MKNRNLIFIAIFIILLIPPIFSIESIFPWIFSIWIIIKSYKLLNEKEILKEALKIIAKYVIIFYISVILGNILVNYISKLIVELFF